MPAERDQPARQDPLPNVFTFGELIPGGSQARLGRNLCRELIETAVISAVGGAVGGLLVTLVMNWLGV